MELQLNYRQLQILKYLITAPTPVDIFEFVETFNKSERTIRYDINIIRKSISPYQIEIRNKSKKGFYIPTTQKQTCSQIVADQTTSTPISIMTDSIESRYNQLLFLLLCQPRMISADVIADKLYLSRSTIIRTLATLTNHFQNTFELEYQKSSGYRIIGDEYKLRSVAASLLSTLFKDSYTTEDWYLLLPQVLKKAINLQRIVSITDSIKKINTKYNVWISNTAFIKLLSYCMIRDIRLFHGCTMESQICQELNILNGNSYEEELLIELSAHLPSPDEKERKWMIDVLIKNGIFVNSEKDHKSELASGINEFIKVLQANKYGYIFDANGLFDDLYEHLKHYIEMKVDHVEVEDNPLLDEIKIKYPDFYGLACDCALIFKENKGLELSDTEISYIAIYLYKNLLNSNFSNKRVLVVCATGKGLSNLLTTRIKNVFHNITIVNQVSPYQIDNQMHWQDIDFIISTIPLKNSRIPVVKISKILTSADIQRIQKFMHYGKLLDDIPFNQNDEASFLSKSDPYDLLDISYNNDKSDIASTSIILSKLLLTLLEYTSKFPKEYQMNQDSLLGLIIHMNMAIPRWFSKDNAAKEDDDLILEYYKFKSDHNAVFQIMDKFFRLVEDSLLITVPISERFAFFLYIINGEEK